MKKKRKKLFFIIGAFVLIIAFVLILIFTLRPKLTDEQLLTLVYPQIKADCDYLNSLKVSGNYTDCLTKCELSSESDFLDSDVSRNTYTSYKEGSNYVLELRMFLTFGRPTYSGDLNYYFVFNKKGEVISENVNPSLEELESSWCY
ncbi:MAG: hypothetical protein WC812_01100 [Candidatus Pacearchaeota archaeon]|jgi:hypothetical protein